MFKSEEHLIEVLTARRNKTYGIDNLREAIASLNHPEEALKIIQIGGTNGKGSTTNFCRAILESNNFKTATFTSPHLVHHRDRIRINNQDISTENFLRLANQTLPLWEKFDLSMFEIDLIIAVLYFVEEKVDYAIVEVGLGGRLDASNVLTPEVIGITNVGMDHVDILGDTIEAIAEEKSGVFKLKVPVYSSELKSNVKTIFNEKAVSSIYYLKEPIINTKKDGYHVVGEYFDFNLNKQASYQAYNANLAIALVLELLPDLNVETIRKAINEAQWPGRFEEIRKNVYLDGAHNEMGINALAKEVHNKQGKKTILFTALANKDTKRMLDILESTADELVLTEFDFPRAASVTELSKGRNVKTIKDYKEAIDYVLSKSNEGSVFITGSLYFISLASSYIKNDLQ